MASQMPPPDVLAAMAKENRGPGMTAGIIVLMVITTIALVLRLFAQHRAKGSLWWDDWTLIVAWVFSMTNAICGCMEFYYAAGRHLANVLTEYADPLPRLESYLTLGWLVTVLWGIALFFTKLSLLLLYYRVFAIAMRPRFKIAYWAVTAFVICVGITTFFVQIFQCTPVDLFWKSAYAYVGKVPPVQGECPAFVPKALAVSSLNLVADVLILAIPIAGVWKLQINWTKRSGLIGIFILGAMTIVVTIVRIPYLLDASLSADSTWGNSYSILFTCLEPLGGVLCACLPCIPPLFARRKTSTAYASGSERRATKPDAWNSVRLNSSDDRDDEYPLNDYKSTSEVRSLPKDAIRMQRDVTVEHATDENAAAAARLQHRRGEFSGDGWDVREHAA